MASSWGLEEVVQCLLEFGANVNAQVRWHFFCYRSKYSKTGCVIAEEALRAGIPSRWDVFFWRLQEVSCSFVSARGRAFETSVGSSALP